MRAILSTLLLLLYFPLCAPAQTRTMYQTPPPPPDNSEQFMAEAFALPATTPDSARIIVMFRMRYDMLHFQRAGSSPVVSQSEFAAVPYIITEAKDSIGIIRSRTEWNDSVFALGADAAIMRSTWISGVTESIVASGKYSVQISIGDRAGSVTRRVKLAPFAAPPHRLSDAAVIFARVVRNITRDRIEPVISNNNAPFEQNSISAVIAIADTGNSVYSYQLTPISTDEWGAARTLTGEAETRSGVRLERISATSVRFPPHRLQFETAPENSLGLRILMVNMPENSIAPGQYRLTITSETGDTLNRVFSIRWENMPASLGSGTYSTEVMRYVLTDQEYEEISSGSESQKRRAVLEYWRKLDPTPFTTYNEAMTEYFRRVDAATTKFSTLAERDGAKSERGKIYILYGWPDSIEQPESPGKFKEVWTYSKRMKKQFIFEQNKAGIYRLSQIIE